MNLTEKLAVLLDKAHIPSERELIGRAFAFYYQDKDSNEKRLTGTIHGTEIVGGPDYDYRDDFVLVTSRILQTRTNDTRAPTLIFVGSRGAERLAHWLIVYHHNDWGGRPDINGDKCYEGTLELL